MGKDSNVNDSASDLEAPLLDHGLDAGVLADGSATPTHRSLIDGWVFVLGCSSCLPSSAR